MILYCRSLQLFELRRNKVEWNHWMAPDVCRWLDGVGLGFGRDTETTLIVTKYCPSSLMVTKCHSHMSGFIIKAPIATMRCSLRNSTDRLVRFSTAIQCRVVETVKSWSSELSQEYYLAVKSVSDVKSHKWNPSEATLKTSKRKKTNSYLILLRTKIYWRMIFYCSCLQLFELRRNMRISLD